MSRISDNTHHNISLSISRVMNEIGVNKKIVTKRRKTFSQAALSETLLRLLHGENELFYFFGSQSEGTTTQGLESDFDCLRIDIIGNVMQDLSEWKHGKMNFLMIQNEFVTPGYCFLQLFGTDAELQKLKKFNRVITDGMGRLLLGNLSIDSNSAMGVVRNGPALTQKGRPGACDTDWVTGLFCQSYPIQARQWSDQHREGYWPSDDMIQCFHTAGCFVVGVGSKGSKNEELEWRISTSVAERYLMLDLNITQIRCYVLMKMVMKTFITPKYSKSISSFMCKTVLLHCISKTRADEWKKSTLFTCLSFCLKTLHDFVLNEYCPHFFIPGNNLMMKRFSQKHKTYILETLLNVIESNGEALFEIKFDFFGERLRLPNLLSFLPRDLVSFNIAGQLLAETARQTDFLLYYLLCKIRNLSSKDALKQISIIKEKYINVGQKDKEIKQHLSFTYEFILASRIDRRGNLSYNGFSLKLLERTCEIYLNVKLKIASVFYSMTDIEKTGLILKNIEERYDISVVEPICACHTIQLASRRIKYNTLCYDDSTQEHRLLRHITASCVRFVRCEINCCPYELRHEMFRSTQEDLAYRTDKDKWMDMAVVDSLPYLYFLQYKQYSRLGKEEERRKALSNLKKTIEEERNLGHKETALNLLGQCMEIEQCQNKAIDYYMLSLKERPINNAAKLLICRLIYNVINSRVTFDIDLYRRIEHNLPF